MKTRKFLAVFLLLSMCLSFMTVSASADFAAHVDEGMFGEDVPDEEVHQDEPSREEVSQEENSGDIQNDEPSQDAVIVPDYEDSSDEETSFEGSFLAPEFMLGASKPETGAVVEVIKGGKGVTYTSWDDAAASAAAGDTMKLLKSISFSHVIIPKGITLDLNGNSITVTAPVGGGGMDLSKSCGFVANDCTVKNGTISVLDSYDDANNKSYSYGNAVYCGEGATTLTNVNVNYEGEGDILSGNVTVGKGCSLSKEPSTGYVKEGFTLEEQADGSFKVVSTTPDAASVGGKKYTYLTEALEAAQEGETVLVLRDVNPPSGIDFSKYADNLTLNLGGCKYTGDMTVTGGKKLTITNGTVDTGNIYTDAALVIGAGAAVQDIYFNGGSLEITSDDASVKDIIVKNSYEGMSLTVSGGKINSISKGIDTEKVAVSVTGGTFAADPSEYVDNTDYKVTKNEDGSFAVAVREMVAEVNGTKYNNFGKARAAAKAGDEITLLKDLGAADFDLDKDLILNLNGKTLKTNIKVLVDVTLTIKDGTLDGDITVEGGTADIQNAAVNSVNGYGTYKLQAATVKAALSPASGELTVSGSGNKINSLYIKGSQDLTMYIEGGEIDAFTKADKPEKVISRITGGVFGADPSGYLAKGYRVEKDTPEKGKFTVSAKEPATLTAPENTEFMMGEANSSMTFTCSENIADEVYVNGEKLVNEAKYTRYSINGKELTLTKKYLNSLDGASYIVEVVPADNVGRAQAGFVVMGVPTLTCNNVPAVYVKGSGQPLVYKANYPITKLVLDDNVQDVDVVLNNKVLGADDFDYVTSDLKTVSIKPEFLDGLHGHHKITLKADLKITDARTETITTVFERAYEGPASLTDAEGKNVTEIKFYKDKNDAEKNKLYFKVDPKVSEIKIDGTALDSKDFQSKSDSVTIGSNPMKELAAGRHEIKFIFANGAEKLIPLYVYPSYVFNTAGYSKGSGKDVKIILSDKPSSVWVGADAEHLDQIDSSEIKMEMKDGKCYITIASEAMERLPEGTVVFDFEYNDVSAMISGFKILGAPGIKPTENNKDAKWAYGSSTLSFKVSPDVKKVYVDGIELRSREYNVKDDVLTLTSSFLKGLEYGEHTLTVETSEGDVKTTFTTKCGIEPKNGNTHTKGGRKNLEFISSDPIEKVIVGNETLKAEYYSLSKDGKTLVLKADFLNRLKADYTYDLTVDTEAGLAFTNFKILSPGSASSNPKTGDEGGMFIWAAVLVLSGIGALALIPRRKKQ